MMVATRSARVSMLVALVAAGACSADDGDDGSMGPATAADGSWGAPASTGVDESTSAGLETSADTSHDEDGSTSTGSPAIDYATQIQPIWDAACTCHLQGPSGTMTATTLTLNADVSYGELVDTPSTQSDLPRIAPGDPAGSYLWRKLEGTQLEVGGMGSQMPQIGELTEEELALIEAWISAGAP